MRECGGLQFLLELVTVSCQGETMEAALYALGCAVEGNGRYSLEIQIISCCNIYNVRQVKGIKYL